MRKVAKCHLPSPCLMCSSGALVSLIDVYPVFPYLKHYLGPGAGRCDTNWTFELRFAFAFRASCVLLSLFCERYDTNCALGLCFGFVFHALCVLLLLFCGRYDTNWMFDLCFAFALHAFCVLLFLFVGDMIQTGCSS